MSQVICVHSFRHGTGKSSITANLAVLIAQQDYRVAILDADVHDFSGLYRLGIHNFFALDTEQKQFSFRDYLEGGATLKDILWDISFILGMNQTKNVHGSLYLIPYNLKHSKPRQVTADIRFLNNAFNKMIAELNVDYLLIDLYPGLSEETLPVLALSDLFVLIFSLDNPDFQGTAVTLDVARRLGIPQTCLLVNQRPKSLDQNAIEMEIEKNYEAKILGILPWVDEMLILASKEVFCLQYPQHFLTDLLKTITQKILLLLTAQVNETGVSVFDLIDDLDDSQQQLLRWIIRQGQVTLGEIVNQLSGDGASARWLISHLLKRGAITEVESDYKIYYKPVFSQRKKRNTRLFKALED